MQIDPRTVAREIPGVLDEVFPQLTPGIVAHFNASSSRLLIQQISPDMLAESRLQRAMLFELGYTVGECLLQGAVAIDWDYCFQETLRRQRVYFDAKLPEDLSTADQKIAEIVGLNIAKILSNISQKRKLELVIKPPISGLEWVGNGYGDFSIGRTLVEVKCIAKNFSAADYRQVAIYWILSYAADIEGRGSEWRDFILLNPRNGQMVKMGFDSFISVLSGGRTKIDMLKIFQSLVGSRLAQ
ncbi:hypothetical protein [Castellaniella sp.]|uniref:hypothetical protein n=1 Tax=Castellaniella sp. TaxID=1955812 RepID=UPI002AFF38F1|nr:hypothetical protein [Castellaniella sp.]